MSHEPSPIRSRRPSPDPARIRRRSWRIPLGTALSLALLAGPAIVLAGPRTTPDGASPAPWAARVAAAKRSRGYLVPDPAERWGK